MQGLAVISHWYDWLFSCILNQWFLGSGCVCVLVNMRIYENSLKRYNQEGEMGSHIETRETLKYYRVEMILIYQIVLY